MDNKTKIFVIVFLLIVITSIIVIIVSIYFLINLTEDTETFNDRCLIEHNDYRSYHKNTDPLILSKQLIESAQRKADQLAHVIDSTDNNKTKLIVGENQWTEPTSESEPLFKKLTCYEAVRSWYGEQKFYIYGIPWPTIPLTKHFTQVVWKSTKWLGCAKSFDKKYVYIVCHYTPKGNAFSQYKHNVMNRNGKIIDI